MTKEEYESDLRFLDKIYEGKEPSQLKLENSWAWVRYLWIEEYKKLGSNLCLYSRKTEVQLQTMLLNYESNMSQYKLQVRKKKKWRMSLGLLKNLLSFICISFLYAFWTVFSENWLHALCISFNVLFIITYPLIKRAESQLVNLSDYLFMYAELSNLKHDHLIKNKKGLFTYSNPSC